MKHIAIIVIFGAFSLQGCSENRKEVSTKTHYEIKEVQTETLTSTPMNNFENSAKVVPATTLVRKQARNKAKHRANRQSVVVRNDEISTGQAAPLIQAQEETLPQDKTYNELQISDDVNDYPLSPEAIRLEKQTYM